MGIEDFIRDALYQPNDYVGYHVGRELAELHPDKTIVEGRNWEFQIEAFARAGRCSVVKEKSVFHHTTRNWEGIGTQPTERIENSWLNVLWQGELLDVVLISWSEACRLTRHHWIVADSQKLAHEFLNAVCEWTCEVRGEIIVFQDGGFQKDTALFDTIKSATFDNLILSGSLKAQIQNDFTQFFNSRETYERYRIPWRRGALFVGPPGNGKTHTVKALINELAQPCIYVRNLGYVDDDMSLLFKRARMVPCVVVFEDLDSMIDDDNRAFFLNELDGFRANTGMVVLATTNHPEKLDAAILERPSRFDRKYHFSLPAQSERLSYVEKWNADLQSELRVSSETASVLVEKTEGFSFAYLKELFVASVTQWIASGEKRCIDEVVFEQLDFLRGQLKADTQKQERKAG